MPPACTTTVLYIWMYHYCVRAGAPDAGWCRPRGRVYLIAARFAG